MTTTEEMPTTTGSVNGDHPGPEEDVRTVASGFVGKAIREQLVAELFDTARRSRLKADTCEQQADQTARAAVAARERALAVRHRQDPDDDHRLARWIAFGGAAAVAAIDAVPCYFAAQAFDLSANDTYVVTGLIVVALAGAMALADGERAWPSPRTVRIGIAVGLALLLGLRTAYMVVTGPTSLASALLASASLTAISGVFIVVGALLLAHRKPPEVAVAEAATARAQKRTREAAADFTAAETAARQATGAYEGAVLTKAMANQPPHHPNTDFIAAVREAIRESLE